MIPLCTIIRISLVKPCVSRLILNYFHFTI